MVMPDEARAKRLAATLEQEKSLAQPATSNWEDGSLYAGLSTVEAEDPRIRSLRATVERQAGRIGELEADVRTVMSALRKGKDGIWCFCRSEEVPELDDTFDRLAALSPTAPTPGTKEGE